MSVQLMQRRAVQFNRFCHEHQEKTLLSLKVIINECI